MHQVTTPSSLPHIFKNALTSPVLFDMIKCVASFFKLVNRPLYALLVHQNSFGTYGFMHVAAKIWIWLLNTLRTLQRFLDSTWSSCAWPQRRKMVLLLLVSTIFNLTGNELILECICGFNLFLLGSELLKIWDDVFCSKATPIEYAEVIAKLRSRYCLKQ